MRNYLRDILFLLGDDRRRLSGLVGLFLGASLLDLVGLGLVVPYVSIVLRPDSVQNYRFDEVLHRIGFSANTDVLLSGLGLALVMAFLSRRYSVYGSIVCIVRFSQDQQIRLRSQVDAAHINFCRTPIYCVAIVPTMSTGFSRWRTIRLLQWFLPCCEC
jgi:hypothetical protein